ncbi:hypothetical protein TSPI_00184 [Trichinella spiralis]|uniref:Uncharacterized protein n=1 Tax=Trichinella spiralis TaxID=6334 RepID=A0ABR3KT29_TRISP
MNPSSQYAISRSPSVTAFIKFLSGIPFSLKPSATTRNIDCPVVSFSIYLANCNCSLNFSSFTSRSFNEKCAVLKNHWPIYQSCVVSYHPEASTPRDPLFFSGQLSLFTTPNPLWESLL